MFQSGGGGVGSLANWKGARDPRGVTSSADSDPVGPGIARRLLGDTAGRGPHLSHEELKKARRFTHFQNTNQAHREGRETMNSSQP